MKTYTILNNKVDVQIDRVSFFFGRYTVELFFPKILKIKNCPEFGVFLRTQFYFVRNLYEHSNWDWSVTLIILGFGIGIAKNHVDNPNVPNNWRRDLKQTDS
jgi:hypothetical protein